MANKSKLKGKEFNALNSPSALAVNCNNPKIEKLIMGTLGKTKIKNWKPNVNLLRGYTKSI